MKLGEIQNCEKCLANYSQYDVKNEKDSNWLERWSAIPEREIKTKLPKWIWWLIKPKVTIKTPKGLCQFCNPKSKYFIC